ncbi:MULTISPECIES: DUF2586 domain-containing protein [unclassified Pseudodesulfovibrio]|uniref:DUF2586 domain-containing protein n=1 Tax=unclassified Pseudodesulfovibrio TaxID=2661612 RepID=UPI000FEBCA0C|nr:MULTISPECIES: DUF2586 domain-containing protein [unclassified Pseudodesulfovibrio]MCJ2164653.1 DUF2586 domain-containing protein [Pseudodesulfovibrio sp. S3-i]RWU04155.1 DUF2586 domain-containing protein [Pseudodesulfovibrio sp. S3]
MALGKVQVNKLNLLQGDIADVERYFLFIGRGAGTNEGKLLNVNNDTDLDVTLGSAASNLKTQLAAAMVNAGQNWNAAVYPLDGVQTWATAVDYAMEHMNCEAIVITDAVTKSSEIESMQVKAEEIMGQYMRPMIFIPTCKTIDPETESWSDFTTSRNALLNELACDQINPVATIWEDDQGAYAGRLCNSSVTVADTPMRVITGAVVGIRSDKPVDKDDVEISMSTLTALDTERWSVPQWYPDYPGVYFGDGNVLDVPGGDYQVIENLRVVHKAMRKVYPLAIAKIGDRKLNSTPASISYHESYFMRPLREMSKSVAILGVTFPGEIEPPKEGDIVISWTTKTAVEIYMTVRPYNCPKAITCNILLDLTNYAE